jgi:hypothetical protein
LASPDYEKQWVTLPVKSPVKSVGLADYPCVERTP